LQAAQAITGDQAANEMPETRDRTTLLRVVNG
jgi:hypothetical protein